ncbi:hypothetical protein TD95_005281 [Thielaviopsis punctulata]|uniref:RING-type domain-containing protein n=1 Tax=Thielaviopsis punctulata TaxID=72032 RepID=A0A0F4ZCV5_9PEZI|nr:hypothetical protein TD95_005281 [Thielaviopsis punctulata]
MSALAAMGVPNPDGDDGTMRCFICLMDSDDAATQTNDWVYPSPCSLVAHHDCMMAWVQDCEREHRALSCPVCKAPIRVDQPPDMVVSFANALASHARSLAPSVLLGLIGSGTMASMGVYGTVALTVFAGRGAPWRFVHILDGMNVRLSLSRLSVLPLIGPALVLGYSCGPVSVPVSLPLFGITLHTNTLKYGSYLAGHDPGAFMWPPTPQAAISLFPYVQAIYRALYREFFREWELKLDTKIEGLPDALVDDPIPARPEIAAPQPPPPPPDEEARPDENDDNNRGGVFGFFREIVHMMYVDYDVEVFAEDFVVDNVPPQHAQMPNRVFVLEEAEEQMEAGERQAGEGQEQAGLPAPQIPHLPHNGIQEVEVRDEHGQPQIIPADDFFQPPHPVADEAPAPAPAPRGLRATLSDIYINIATALLLPGISAGVGELLRLALPQRFTTMPVLSSAWSSMWAGPRRQPTGLLQTQWGRSLVGGCVYIVVRDAFRLYVKYRKSLLAGRRRVRNVKRKNS